MNKLVVLLYEDKPVEIEKYNGDLLVGKRTMGIDDFKRTIINEMDEIEHVGYLIENNFTNVMMNYLDEIEDEKLYVKAVSTILSRIDINEIQPNSYHALLETITRNITLSDSDNETLNYQELLHLLLERGKLNENIVGKLYSKIIKLAVQKANTCENEDELEVLFKTILSKAKGEWAHSYIEQMRPKLAIFEGFMPKNIIYHKRTLGSDIVVIDIPKTLHNVKYGNVQYKNVGHPRMFFYFKIINKRIVKIKISSVKDNIVNENTKLYNYPFSHVYNNHDVCWSYGEYIIESLENLQHIPYIFLSTPNSGHFNSQTLEYFKKLDGKEFDDSLLNPSGLTFKEFVE